MSVIKKLFIVAVVIITVTGTAALGECKFLSDQYEELGQTKGEVKASETAPATKEIVAETKVNGVIYETDKFSILQPDGWKVTVSSGGVLFEKGGDAMLVNVGDGAGSTEAFLKKLVDEIAKLSNGTAVEEVTMFGGKFFQTRGTLEGKDTTFAWGLTNGLAVNLVMIGKDHPNNVEIKAMLDSLKFK